MSNLEEIEKKLKERLRNSRVGGELEHLSGQYFAGSLLKTFLIALAHSGLIMFVAYLLYVKAAEVLSFTECHHACFHSIQGACCIEERPTITTGILFLVLAFFGSLISTLFTPKKKLQRSSIVGATLVLGLLLTSRGATTPLWALGVMIGALVLSVFFGYRLGVYFVNHWRK